MWFSAHRWHIRGGGCIFPCIAINADNLTPKASFAPLTRETNFRHLYARGYFPGVVLKSTRFSSTLYTANIACTLAPTDVSSTIASVNTGTEGKTADGDFRPTILPPQPLLGSIWPLPPVQVQAPDKVFTCLRLIWWNLSTGPLFSCCTLELHTPIFWTLGFLIILLRRCRGRPL